MFIAQKPCSFAGRDFFIGQEIPGELVHPEAKTRLIKNGVIAEAAGAGALLPAQPSIEEAATIKVPIQADEGEITLEFTVDDVATAIVTVMKPEEEILADIETITSDDVLILIDAIKGESEPVHKAAAARAAALREMDCPKEEPEYTEDQLMKHKRDELVEIAEGMGITVTIEDTKAVITAAILEKQAGSDV